jgi:dUTPase
VVHSSNFEELFIPLQNNGRGQVNLLPGDLIARGIVVKTEQAEIVEVTSPPPTPKSPKTRPSKKNSDIKFEIK